MTLPVVPGSSLSFSQVNTELGYSSTAQISLNDSAVRTLAGVGASPATIAITNLSGKSNVFNFTISSNQTNANLRTLAIAAGWGGTSVVNATVGSGVYVYSTSTGTPGLTIDGSWPGGVTLINNGYIMGQGGAGATNDGSGSGPFQPTAGGSAISLGISCTVTNNSYIGGGGGGGGMEYGSTGQGGGGAGGGAGGYGGSPSYYGGAGGGPGSVGGNGGTVSTKFGPIYGGGGGGGRIMPGTGGTGGAANILSYGGGAGGGASSNSQGSRGGAGGSAGNAGSIYTGGQGGGGGGGWGASGGTGRIGGGAAGGKAIALNGFTVTQNGAGTTYGAVS